MPNSPSLGRLFCTVIFEFGVFSALSSFSSYNRKKTNLALHRSTFYIVAITLVNNFFIRHRACPKTIILCTTVSNIMIKTRRSSLDTALLGQLKYVDAKIRYSPSMSLACTFIIDNTFEFSVSSASFFSSYNSMKTNLALHHTTFSHCSDQ